MKRVKRKTKSAKKLIARARKRHEAESRGDYSLSSIPRLTDPKDWDEYYGELERLRDVK